jgi:hypothetical protein
LIRGEVVGCRQLVMVAHCIFNYLLNHHLKNISKLP